MKYTIIEKSYITAESSDHVLTDWFVLEENDYSTSEDLVDILNNFEFEEELRPELYKKIFTELSKDNPIIIFKVNKRLSTDAGCDPLVCRKDNKTGFYITYRVIFHKDYILKIEEN